MKLKKIILSFALGCILAMPLSSVAAASPPSAEELQRQIDGLQCQIHQLEYGNRVAVCTHASGSPTAEKLQQQINELVRQIRQFEKPVS